MFLECESSQQAFRSHDIHSYNLKFWRTCIIPQPLYSWNSFSNLGRFPWLRFVCQKFYGVWFNFIQCQSAKKTPFNAQVKLWGNRSLVWSLQRLCLTLRFQEDTTGGMSLSGSLLHSEKTSIGSTHSYIWNTSMVTLSSTRLWYQVPPSNCFKVWWLPVGLPWQDESVSGQWLTSHISLFQGTAW